MSNSKNYNSILFITTLSVYFGLVLVGATPSVLAQQAALTQRLEIKNEIEVEDDLDKNPDEDKILSEYFDSYQLLYSLVKDFSEQYADRSGNYEFNCSAFTAENRNYAVRCTKGTGAFSSVFIPQISRIRNVFSSEIAGKERQIDVNLLISKSDFSIKTSFQRNPDLQKSVFDNFLNEIVFHSKVQNLDDRFKFYGQETAITSENDQIFIVTNLPRASIDAFLANNAK